MDEKMPSLYEKNLKQLYTAVKIQR